MAQLPLPARAGDGDELILPGLGTLPREVLRRLADAGHEAAIVGGSLRDALLGQDPHDWDVATSATPDQVVALFPGATWENRFGTVTVHGDDGQAQVTTYRAEGGYRDRRRPDDVRFGVSLNEDLARRDFTINAMAWVAVDLDRGHGRLVDPLGGAADLRHGLLRAVGDPHARFGEDALRLLRALRFGHRFGLQIDPATEGAIRDLAPSAAAVSGERARDELLRILATAARPPSEAFLLMERLGLLAVLLPELQALRGVPQEKRVPGDALDHSLRCADEAASDDLTLRLAALLHDLGKAETLAHGHFIGHERVGAEIAGRVLERLRLPGARIAAIVHVIGHHMFAYTPDWNDAAVRRFVRRVGTEHLGLLFGLRRADNAASGVTEPPAGGLVELERRIEETAADPLGEEQLAIDGHDLQRELGLEPGPAIGAVLGQLMEAVLDDPRRNDRATLLRLARDAVAGGGPTRT